MVSALAGTHQGRDYKVNKNGGCLCLHRLSSQGGRILNLGQNKVLLILFTA